MFEAIRMHDANIQVKDSRTLFDCVNSLQTMSFLNFIRLTNKINDSRLEDIKNLILVPFLFELVACID